MKKSFMAEKIKKACKTIGCTVEFGPKYGASGKIVFSDIGKNVYFVNCCFDVNPYGASLVARNKGLTRTFLQKHHIKMPKGAYFSHTQDKYSSLSPEDFEAAIFAYAEKLGYPVVLKGADIHRGECVYFANNRQEVAAHLPKIWAKTEHLVIEEFIPYTCYRILVFDGNVIACYGKEPFSITGNGKSSIKALVKQAKARLKKLDIVTDFSKIDDKLDEFIQNSTYEWGDILPDKTKLSMIDVGNISMGGTIIDYTDCVNDKLKSYCKNLAEIMNLDLIGIDIMSKDISVFPKQSYLIEVNSSPSLESYSKCGREQDKKTDVLVKKLIEQMKKNVENT